MQRERPEVTFDTSRVALGDALDLYGSWGTPTAIVSDGPYGIAGYEGDPGAYADIVEMYRPHVRVWSERAIPETTLWFFGTELGWAMVHPLLAEHGWVYRSLNVWDKGIGHIAGNVNTQTMRKFPVVTEVCAHYVRPQLVLKPEDFGGDWMRAEWARTGLPFRVANEACGVKDAATRKWLSGDLTLWYPPPPARYEMLAKYANTHGDPAGRPYFTRPVEALVHQIVRRGKFHCPVGVTNVWSEPHTPRSGRSKGAPHPNQKPLMLVRRIVEASTDEGDLVWEPFGGTCPTAYVCRGIRRRCESAEIMPSYYEEALRRLGEERPDNVLDLMEELDR